MSVTQYNKPVYRTIVSNILRDLIVTEIKSAIVITLLCIQIPERYATDRELSHGELPNLGSITTTSMSFVLVHKIVRERTTSDQSIYYIHYS